MKLLKITLTTILFLNCISCSKLFEQNPLTGVPDQLKEGALDSGVQHFSKFESMLIDDFLKVAISGKEDLTMNFKERQQNTYTLTFRFLHGFESKYELIIPDNSFKNLEGSNWRYVSETGDSKVIKIDLSWTPPLMSNRSASYERRDVILPLTLKKKGFPNKGFVSSVKRKIQVFVERRSFSPEIFKVHVGNDVNYESYVKLSDGNFYKSTEVKFLYLNHYESLFAKEKTIVNREDVEEIIKLSIKDSFIFKHIYLLFKSTTYYGSNTFYRRKSDAQAIPRDFILHIRPSFYHEVEDSEENSACVNDSNKDGVCLAELKGGIDPKKAVYVRDLNIPVDFDLNNLYYEIKYKEGMSDLEGLPSVKDFCYKNFSSSANDFQQRVLQQKSGPVEREEYDKKESCFIKLTSVKPYKFLLALESHQMYTVNDKAELEKIDISKDWGYSFRKLDDFIAWQLSGHQPITGNILPVLLTGESESLDRVTFFVNDVNSFVSPPRLKNEDQLSLINRAISWEPTIQKPKMVERGQWKVGFDLNSYLVIDKLQNIPYEIAGYSPKFGLRGNSVKFQVSILPYVLEEIEDFFDPNTVEVYKDSISGEYSFTIKNKIKNTWIFSPDFLKGLKTLNSNHSNNDNKENLLKSQITFPEIVPSSKACRIPEDHFDQFKCECDKLSFKEGDSDEDENIYAENLCKYETRMTFNLKQDESYYMQYDHEMSKPESISLNIVPHYKTDISILKRFYQTIVPNQVDGVESKGEAVRKAISDPNPPSAPDTLNTEIHTSSYENLFHIFFNLKPRLKCAFSSVKGVRQCSIKYPLTYIDFSPGNAAHVLNHDDVLFSKDAIQLDLSPCLYYPDKEANDEFYKQPNLWGAPCVCKKAVIVPRNRTEPYSLNSECFFTRNDPEVTVFLKTNNPFIYFINKDSNDLKRTLLEHLFID